jgi:hypothetical protein
MNERDEERPDEMPLNEPREEPPRETAPYADPTPQDDPGRILDPRPSGTPPEVV